MNRQRSSSVTSVFTVMFYQTDFFDHMCFQRHCGAGRTPITIRSWEQMFAEGGKHGRKYKVYNRYISQSDKPVFARWRPVMNIQAASIKLAPETELISCISDLAAFDLKPKTIKNKDIGNTVGFKMTWRITRWIWGTRREYFNENSIEIPTAKENFFYPVAITCYFLPWKHIWQHNNIAICSLSYCMRLHAAASLRARNNPALWQITIA